MKKSSKILLDPNLLKRSEIYYQHKREFLGTSLEIKPGFNFDQT